MDLDDSGSRGASASIELTNTEAELLTLLESFVCLVTSDVMINMQVLPEICGTPFIEAVKQFHRESL
jgi:hypothetical protein